MKKISFNLNDKNVVITGGSGFFGNQIVNELLNTSANVYIIDIKKPKKKTKAMYFNSDITNENELNKILNFFKKKKKKIKKNNLNFKKKKKKK